MRCRFIAFFTLTLYFTGSVLAGVVTGNVTGVLDGDTLEVLHHKHPERIRLNGIDCPEKGQAYGKRAKQATSELVFGKDVTLRTYGLDKDKRTIGDVFLPDGINASRTLVKEGWCWWYREYAPGDKVLEGLERDAREARKGLWADSHPAPHGFLRCHRSHSTLCSYEKVVDSRRFFEGHGCSGTEKSFQSHPVI